MAQNIDTSLMLRMEASLAKFEKQMQRATQVGTSTATGLEKRYDAMGKRMGASSEKAARGLSNVINIGGSGRFVLQNTAAQIGDIAVQMEMGTSASRIMAQQLPQLLGGFGALGGALGLVAPLLGTVAAVGIPLAAMFFTLSGDSEEAAEKVQTFAEKLDIANDAIARATASAASAGAGGIEDLRVRYGEVTQAVTELADALAEIEQRAAQTSVGTALTSILGDVTASGDQLRQSVEGYAAAQERLNEVNAELMGVSTMGQDRFDLLDAERQSLEQLLATLGPIKAQMETISDEMNIWPEDAAALAAGMMDARAAVRTGDFQAAADQLAEMRDFAESLGLTLGDEVVQQIAKAEDTARYMAGSLSDAESNASGVGNAAAGAASQVGVAADEAARLTQNLGGALAQLAGIASGIASAQRAASQAAQMRIDYAGDPVGYAGAKTRSDVQEQTGALAYAAIRSGSTPTLEAIRDTTNELAAGAEAAAQMEENASAAEAAAAAAIKAAAGGGSSGGGGGRSRGGGSTKTETPFFESVEREVQSIQRQIEAIGKSKAEVAELTARYRLLDEAKRRGMTVTDELTSKIETEAAKVGQLAAEYEAATDKMKAIEDVKSGIDQIADSLANAIVQGESLGDVFGSVVQRMAADLISSGISSMIGSIFSGAGAGGTGGGFFGSMFGGARAAGGPVTGGKTYLVGERGPELFTPPGSGQIIPNDKLGGAGAGAGNMSISVNVTGANGDQHVIALVQEGVSRGLAQYDAGMPQRVKGITRDPRVS